MGNSLHIPRRENPEAKEEEEDEFTCEICTEITSENKKFKNKNLCTHPFCQDCIAKYIEAKVEDDNAAKIECPGLECLQFLNPISCKPIIPQNLFAKWCDILLKNYLLGFERRYCPNRNCMALVVNECGGRRRKVKKAECPICKQWFCFQCKLAWHEGYRCEEIDKVRDQNDISFGQLVEDMTWARCPGCGHCVQRDDGCRTIHCRCNTIFCYYCERKPPYCSCNERTDGRFSAIFLILLLLGLIFIYIYSVYHPIMKIFQDIRIYMFVQSF